LIASRDSVLSVHALFDALVALWDECAAIKADDTNLSTFLAKCTPRDTVMIMPRCVHGETAQVATRDAQ
jgi:hypothetical protein